MKNNNGVYHLTVHEDEVKQLELRSEELQDILGTAPPWTIRAGSAWLLAMVILAFITCWFIKYPDIIKAPVVLTTNNPPTLVVSKYPGHLTLLTKDKQEVQRGDYLGVISNGADLQAVAMLKNNMLAFRDSFYTNPLYVNNYQPAAVSLLGELQNNYNAFVQSIKDIQFNDRRGEFDKKSSQIRGELQRYNDLSAQQREQVSIMSGELTLSAQSFERDSILYAQKVISKSEFEQKKQTYLASQRAYKSNISAIANTEIQKTQLQGRRMELSLNSDQVNKDLLLRVETAMNELDVRLKAWEEAYVLTAPVSGTLSLFDYWANGQYVKSQEEILSVIPSNNGHVAKAHVPIMGSGKIRAGQRVNIKLNNYPFEEYGMLQGRVESISLVPKADNYTLTISLTSELRTSYGKQIEFRQEMNGTAEVITEELRLLERVFFNIRKLF
jgi:multidrug resistance efflux pump